MHGASKPQRWQANRLGRRVRPLVLAVLALAGLTGCLQVVQPEPDVMIVTGPTQGGARLRIPFHAGHAWPANPWLVGGFWYDPWAVRPWGLSPYAGAFTSLYYPWYGWSPVGWHRSDPVWACQGGGRRGPDICRAGWLVPADQGPVLVPDDPAPGGHSALVPYRPTYGGTETPAERFPGELSLIREARRYGEHFSAFDGRRSGFSTPSAAGDRHRFGTAPRESVFSRASSVHSAGRKPAPSRTQPIGGNARPDVYRPSQAARPAIQAHRSRGAVTRSSRGAVNPAAHGGAPVRSISPESRPPSQP